MVLDTAGPAGDTSVARDDIATCRAAIQKAPAVTDPATDTVKARVITATMGVVPMARDADTAWDAADTKAVVTKAADTPDTKAAVVTAKGKNAVGGIDFQIPSRRGSAMKKPNAGAAWNVHTAAVVQKAIADPTNV